MGGLLYQSLSLFQSLNETFSSVYLAQLPAPCGCPVRTTVSRLSLLFWWVMLLLSRCVLTLGREGLLARALVWEGSLAFPLLLQEPVSPEPPGVSVMFEAAQRVRKVRAQPSTAHHQVMALPGRQQLPRGQECPTVASLTWHCLLRQPRPGTSRVDQAPHLATGRLSVP